MEKIKIITDSTCDLPQELIEKNDIDVISLMVNIGGKEYYDRTELDGKGLFKLMDKTGDFPKTSQVTPQRFLDKFKEYTDQGYEVICINLSSKMSGTYQSAEIAKNMMEEQGQKVSVIDSLNVTAGLGMLVLFACEMKKRGLSRNEIVKEVIDTIPRVKSSLFFNSLDSLIKGGRISKTAGAIGSLLSVKPILCVEDGEMKVREKQRGSKKAMRALMNYVAAREIDEIVTPIILQAGEDKLFNTIKDEYCKIKGEYIESEVGCIVGTHSGPNAGGIFFIEKA